MYRNVGGLEETYLFDRVPCVLDAVPVSYLTDS